MSSQYEMIWIHSITIGAKTKPTPMVYGYLRHCFFCSKPFEPRRPDIDTCVPCARGSVNVEVHGQQVRVVRISDDTYVARRGDTKGTGGSAHEAARKAYKNDVSLKAPKGVKAYIPDEDSDLARESRMPHRSITHRRPVYDIRQEFKGYKDDSNFESDED